VSIATAARIAAGVLALTIAVRPTEAQQQTAVRVPASVLERYVGEYVHPAGGTVMVRLRGDTLFSETPGRWVPFVPLSETSFMFGPNFTAEFVIDQAGGVTQILTSAATEYRLRRKGSPPEKPAPAPAAVRVPRSVLERYVGIYEYIPGQMNRTDLRVVIRLKGDTLTRWMGREETVLTPISETRFRVGSTSLVTEFVIDEAGVTQVLGSGRHQLLARLTAKR
jgi:hypothetical protein